MLHWTYAHLLWTVVKRNVLAKSIPRSVWWEKTAPCCRWVSWIAHGCSLKNALSFISGVVRLQNRWIPVSSLRCFVCYLCCYWIAIVSRWIFSFQILCNPSPSLSADPISISIPRHHRNASHLWLPSLDFVWSNRSNCSAFNRYDWR